MLNDFINSVSLYLSRVQAATGKDHILKMFFSLQILKMSMWNYGTDVMDALMELVISLVCGSRATVCNVLVINLCDHDSSSKL